MKKSKSLLQFIIVTLFIFNEIIAFGQHQISYGNNKEVGKFIPINGVNLYYEVYGQGEPLLLIHGNKTGISGWKPQIDFFSKNYTVYAIDCRGRGQSELGKDSLSYLQMANDLSVFIDKMEIDSVNIIGKSDGGIVALLLGIYYPTHLKKIVSFGANVLPDSTALFPQTIEQNKAERRFADEMLQKQDTSQNWLVIQQRLRMMEFQPTILADELQKIKVPVLVMSCDRDVIKAEHTFYIYKNIPYSNLSIFPGEVHGVTRLNSELFNSTVYHYLITPYQHNSIRFK